MIWRKSNQPIVSIPILSSLIFSKKYPLLWNASLCIRSIQLSTCFDVLPQQCDGASARAVNTRLLLLFPLSLSLSPSLSVEAPPCCMWFPNICVSPGYGWILCFAQLLCQSTIHRCTSEYFACLICLSVQWSSNSLLVCLIFCECKDRIWRRTNSFLCFCCAVAWSKPYYHPVQVPGFKFSELVSSIPLMIFILSLFPMIFCADWNLIHDDNSSHASQLTLQQQRPHLSLAAAAAVDAANTKSRNCKAPPCLWQLPLTVNIQLSIGRLEGRQERLWNVIKLTERESELCKR